jgi:hypothetical protein
MKPTDMAEHVLGHVIPGVRGVYDRHTYGAESWMCSNASAFLRV